MKAQASPMSVAEYCEALNEKRIIVNQEYQRQGGLWSKAAQSFFIESIILGYPIPKLFLYQKLDLKTRRISREIVDGQQRSLALQSFFNNKLRLSSSVETDELRGRSFDELEDWQGEFLTYSLPIDQFTGPNEEEVREAFRRINANNVPLNPEEQRNARFQGPFKWFIVELGHTYQEPLLNIGLFTKSQLIRMGDYKLYTEILQTVNGRFQTQKALQLDNLYKQYNTSFPLRDEFEQKLRFGLDFLLMTDSTHRRELLRAPTTQTLVLAAIANRFGGMFFDDACERYSELWAATQATDAPLTLLVQALQDRDAYPELRQFVDACQGGGSNVERNRVTRFFYFVIALRQEI